MIGMRVAELGERALIERIRKLASRAGAADGAAIALGPGDDAALLRLRAGEVLAVTTDASVHGVHFRFDQESPRGAGRRALVANLSDLAAMGARPLAFTLALATPPHLETRVLFALLRGVLESARAFRCPLAGGNVTRARELSLNITAHGALRAGRALTRNNGRAGDRVFVTGALGAAALARARGRVRHVPVPRLKAGRALARMTGVGAALDISDGVLADLGQLCRASGCGAEIFLAKLPRPRGFERACRRARLDPAALLLGGGEDYELLFTLRARAAGARELTRKLGVTVSEIGRLRARAGVQIGDAPRPSRAGWTHF